MIFKVRMRLELKVSEGNWLGKICERFKSKSNFTRKFEYLEITVAR